MSIERPEKGKMDGEAALRGYAHTMTYTRSHTHMCTLDGRVGRKTCISVYTPVYTAMHTQTHVQVHTRTFGYTQISFYWFLPLIQSVGCAAERERKL